MRHPSFHRLLVVIVVASIAAAGVALAGHGKCAKSSQECAALMKEKFQTKGWSGIEKEHNEDGTLTVLSVVPNGPADKAGLKAGDVLVSINGVTLSKENEAKLQEMKQSAFKIGESVSYGVRRGQETLSARVTLERIPEAALAAMIDRHAKEEHAVARN
jgi:S1-C subfamily serine protease